ncbi:hypothetical protein HNW77_11935 [Komagataeibacter sp. AV436]|uniref:NACHT domain-containing protein n=1 Tax=Komagataeibacter melomenusus TaxID=2766578 RepID=A0ABX2AGT9_9PROT|nr:hypothetical protein [Komagataeibacter melomenusus]MBV1829053.1 hypothetical protein [Komagataeibacter melomenusus]NPC67087.1 hypothetical protein [Komagataeibacter melomenusus]
MRPTEYAIADRIYKKINNLENEEDIANDARIATEGCCKLLIFLFDRENYDAKTSGKTLRSLCDSLKHDVLGINATHLKKIKSCIEKIMTLGNIGSHDGSVILEKIDIGDIIFNINRLIHLIFNSKEYINIDFELPNGMYKLIHKQDINNQNWRCDQIIKIVYPGRKVKIESSSQNYQFYNISDADGRSIGILFLHRNISMKNTIDEVIDKSDINSFDSIQILTPLERNKETGKPISTRVSYITDCFKQNNKVRLEHEKIKGSFIEDYIFNLSLESHKENIIKNQREPFFVEQKLVKYSDRQREIGSMDFINSIINKKPEYDSPIYFIFGEGGIGKTTFCKEAVRRINSIGENEKKIGVIISSFDIPNDASVVHQVNTIQDLYKLANINNNDSISQEIFSINVRSGNIIVIVDGMDEIISKLKDKFSIKNFIESVYELNDTYLNCSVIICSRNLKLDEREGYIHKLSLKGFDNPQIEDYLSKRFDNDKIKQRARNIIGEIYDKEYDSRRGQITPLVIKLASDLSAEDGSISFSDASSDFLIKKHAIDKIIYLIVNREIKKHDLNIDFDKYFIVLKEIVFSSSASSVDEEELNFIIDIATVDMEDNKKRFFIKAIYSSPLLHKIDNFFIIRYDSLDFWVKSRYMVKRIKENNPETDGSVLNAMARDCYAGGALVKDISINRELYGDYEKNTIHYIKAISEKDDIVKNRRKILSAYSYIYCSRENLLDKEKTTDFIIFLYGGKLIIENMAIYGDFFPLDFTNIKVVNGYFNSYSSLHKCNFPDHVVFEKSVFENFQDFSYGRESIKRIIFDDNCILCESIGEAIATANNNANANREKIKKDFDKIFRVGFKDGSFVWKSEQVYRQQCSTLKTNKSINDIMNVLCNFGIFSKVSKRERRGYGWVVSDDFQKIVEDYLTQGILHNKIDECINSIAKP